MKSIIKQIAIDIAKRGALFNKKIVDSEESFGSKVFNDRQQRKYLPKEVYKKLRKTIENQNPLDAEIANYVASGMKIWATAHGASHFTHWFQPLTGTTAEKHDAFYSVSQDEQTIGDFSGKELIQGEPDASSFPSGGIRETFEARGYTAWDPTSSAFILETGNGAVLFIPTAFCSYTGEALDLKTPLLRSIEAISKSASKLLKILGKETNKVFTTAGLEQEFFVIDAEYFNLRPDLISTGRTLFGNSPFKGQELSDHYFGSMNRRILEFIQDAEHHLYELGIPMKTRHNEVAPCQYEVAPIFENANVAVDHNLLVMQVLKEIAVKHNLRVLLHEKPFAGMNGSGKHCNWSLSTAEGENLLDPGKNAYENMNFMVILGCIIRSIDLYAKLLRISVASAGNDHRLGANEAPPAIISVFLGEHLQKVVDAIVKETSLDGISNGKIKLGVSTLPSVPLDNTDRNRTSPFAFTGNKFEFRALGSNQNPSNPNYAINAAVADSFDYATVEIEKLIATGKSVREASNVFVRELLKKHGRVIFNGDGYSQEWHEEAEKRGLLNLKTSPEAFARYADEDLIQLLEKYNVISKGELLSRQNVRLERFVTQLLIEAKATSDIASTMILPACWKTQNDLAEAISKTKDALLNMIPGGWKNADLPREQVELLRQITNLINNLVSRITDLDKMRLVEIDDLFQHAEHIRKELIPAMDNVRKVSDELELLVDDSYWPMPKYSAMLSIV